MGLHSERCEAHEQLAHMKSRETPEVMWHQSQAYCLAIWARVEQSIGLHLACRLLPKLATHPSRIALATP
jgi:hypothetical protein